MLQADRPLPKGGSKKFSFYNNCTGRGGITLPPLNNVH
ncbi:hypothetical protein TREPR_2132 [Treponema primitia ZAS-2]|uniref:Uncharacterized protein n=1 Tax=Treponema primitia (strain ATCC BAA-887 / DSM 12427 / ZAS-2) TaxID=545694 RepID=F5YJ62_TREPZ|nr:hypothetical protein TREPR_2132 [Treponema primitia ZAS-2]